MDFYRKLQEDERETLAHLEDELRGEKTMTRSVFGWDLPPGVTLNDIDRLDEPAVEISDEESQRLDALAQEDVEHTRNGYGASERHYDPFLPDYPEDPVPDTLQSTEMQWGWNKVDALFKQGFVQGEDVWWNASDLRRYKAVYLADLQGKAGIALMMYNEPWVPYVVEYGKISLRLDD